MGDSVLESENRQFLGERFPKFEELITKAVSTFRLEKKGSGSYVKNNAGRYLTRQTEEEYSRLRMEAFLSKPPRLSMVSKKYAADDLKEIWNTCVSSFDFLPNDERWNVAPEISESQGLIIFDVGRLKELETIIKEELYSISSILIIISDFDYFFAKIQEENWRDFISEIDNLNVFLNVVFVKDHAETIGSIRQFIWTKHITFPDNILCYFHFAGSAQKSLWARVRSEYQSMVSGVGFFYDELGMFAHTEANLLEGGNKVLTRSENLRSFGRCFIVGSGPSIDTCINSIADNLNESFVIAAGTAVEPLLKAGISVDVCVVLERGTDLLPIYEAMAERVDLSGVTLVASSTTVPKLGNVFKDSIYFLRPGLNVHAGFSRNGKHTLFHCDPTVSNTALALAHFLGFQQCIFVGVDMGALNNDLHHSKDSAYYTDNLPLEVPFNLPAVAEFGGSAITNYVLKWSRQCLENLINLHNGPRQCISLSNGVEIRGVLPLLPEIATELDVFFPVEEVELPDLADFSTLFKVTDFNYSLETWEEINQKVKQIFEKFSWGARREVATEFYEVLWKPSNTAPFPMIIRGSLVLLLWHAYSILSRLRKEERRVAENTFQTGLLAVLGQMDREIRHRVLKTQT